MAFVYNIGVDNVNQALGRGLALLRGRGEAENSRNGTVLVAPGPVMTIYENPQRRVLFSPLRDANPFFHLFESLWMLAGRNDLPWVVQFNKRFNSYSDDGGLTQPAAYGHRWRNYFGYDQLEGIVRELSENPGSRRAVLAMWDGGMDRDNSILVPTELGGDLGRAIYGSADIPCNTQCFFRIVHGRLDMQVTCRSNDIIWGAYGANAVHFSVLQEYLAARLGVRIGTMYQLSFNYHLYTNVVGDKLNDMILDAERHNFYLTKSVRPMPMFDNPMVFMAELPKWMDWAAQDRATDKVAPFFNEPFLNDVATPMRAAWSEHKAKNYGVAAATCGAIKADDWRYACVEWIERRAQRHREREVGGQG